MSKKNAKATIVICHGFMCDKFDVGFLRYLFEHYNVVTFDFRAHGENTEGQYCTFGKEEMYDVISVVQFLKNHPDLKETPIFAYAFSMGAVAAILAQAEHKDLFEGMILDCPYESSKNIITRGLESIQFSFLGWKFKLPGVSLLKKYAFHRYIQSFVKRVLKTVARMDSRDIEILLCPVCTAEVIKTIRIPIFLIHCENDEKIPVHAAKKVFDSAVLCLIKELWITEGRKHYDSLFYNPEVYKYKVNQFIKRVLELLGC